MADKNETPVSASPRDAFIDAASPIEVTFAQKGKVISRVYADPRKFGTGSVGWNSNGKVQLPVGEENYPCQMGVNLTVIGSKDW